MKKMILFGALLCGVSGLWGDVTVVGDGIGNVTITIDGGDTTITADDFVAATNTQEGVITGDLIIKGEDALTTIEENAFAGLTRIGGDLVLCDGAFGQTYPESQNTSLATIHDNAFPDLTTVTGEILCHQCAITSLVLPKLTEVGEDLQADNNPQLTTLSLPALQSVGQAIFAHSNPQLTTLSLPALQSVGNSFFATSNPQLTTLSLPALQSVGQSLGVINNIAMTTLELPALQSVGESLWVEGCTSLSRIPFNLFDVVQIGIDTQAGGGALSKFVSDLPEGVDKDALTGQGINPAIASAALKRNPQVTVNVPGVPRSLNIHLKTHYPVSGQSDSDAQPAKHGMLRLVG